MPKEIKFTQEELDKINEFRQKYLDTQMGFGQTEITRLRLGRQLDNLDTFIEDLRKQFEIIQKDEQEFIAEINKTYGDVNIDIKDGTLSPLEKVEEPVVEEVK